MTEEEKYDMYERCIPKYLKHDIDEYIKVINSSEKCLHIDCLVNEIYGSINLALYGGEIKEEQANYLRDKYCFGYDWRKGERRNGAC